MTRRAIVLLGVLALGGTLGAQAVIDYFPGKVVIGSSSSIGTGSALEVLGQDAGIGVVSTGIPAQSEGFYAIFQRDGAGVYQKTMSLSTVYGDPDHEQGYAITRLNTTYQDFGVQRDDLAFLLFGNRGVSVFDPAPGQPIPPGHRVMQVHGTLKVQEMDVAATIAALEARIAALEARMTSPTGTPTAPTPGPICNPTWFVRTKDLSGCVPPDHPLAPVRRQ